MIFDPEVYTGDFNSANSNASDGWTLPSVDDLKLLDSLELLSSDIYLDINIRSKWDTICFQSIL